MTVKRFSTFEDASAAWQTLENENFHYPFQSLWYLQLFAKNFCNPADVYLLGIYDQEKLMATGAFEKIGDELIFLGMKQVLSGQDTTDYGDLLYATTEETTIKSIWETLFTYCKDQQCKSMRLDFVREDSLTYHYFQQNNKAHISRPQANAGDARNDVSVFIPLPKTWDDYLQSLERTDRKELKRKIKRLETQQTVRECTSASLPHDFAEFIRLHRLSDSKKETFMSESMKAYFWQLVSEKKDTWDIHFCYLLIDGKTVASIMSFQTTTHILLYNSGFDPAYGYYSVGLLLNAYMIKQAIADGKKVFDFLRGDERYKYDLGGKEENLYKITISLG